MQKSKKGIKASEVLAALSRTKVIEIMEARKPLIDTHMQLHDEVILFVYTNNAQLLDQIRNPTKAIPNTIEIMTLQQAREILPNSATLASCDPKYHMCVMLATELANNKRVYYSQTGLKLP